MGPYEQLAKKIKRSTKEDDAHEAWAQSAISRFTSEDLIEIKELNERFTKEGPRYLYEFIISDLSIRYVGITGEIKRRTLYHMRNKKEFQKAAARKTLYFNITHSKFEPGVAAILERKRYEELKNHGITLLNKAPAGGLGGKVVKWDKEACKVKGLTFKTTGEWQSECKGSYNAAQRNGWLSELTTHMDMKEVKPVNYWRSTEVVIASTSKYRGKGWKAWARAYPGAVSAAGDLGILDQVKAIVQNPNLRAWGTGTFDVALEEAKQFTNHAEWRKHSKSLCQKARRKKWMAEICRLAYGSSASIDE